ncbi:MAG: hypothetical protein EXR62_17985 [Chloroflexi bacterium]|nr:hypothetical protein [Chloroflexota bacterium]
MRRTGKRQWLWAVVLAIAIGLGWARHSGMIQAAENCGGWLYNGCFEATIRPNSEIDGWTVGGNQPTYVVKSNSQQQTYTCQGDYSVRLGTPIISGQPQPAGGAFIIQDVTIPASSLRPEVHLCYRIITNDIRAWSDFRVDVLDVNGQFLQQLYEDGYANEFFATEYNDLGWNSAILDLSAYKGRRIRLRFWSQNKYDGSLGIWTFLDSVIALDARYRIRLPIVSRNSSSPTHTAASSLSDPSNSSGEFSQKRRILRPPVPRFLPPDTLHPNNAGESAPQ